LTRLLGIRFVPLPVTVSLCDPEGPVGDVGGPVDSLVTSQQLDQFLLERLGSGAVVMVSPEGLGTVVVVDGEDFEGVDVAG